MFKCEKRQYIYSFILLILASKWTELNTNANIIKSNHVYNYSVSVVENKLIFYLQMYTKHFFVNKYRM